jgi:transposase
VKWSGARSGDKKKDETKRRRGGQKGHPGNKRELLPVEQVTDFVELFPRQCENCRVALPQTRDENAERYQVTEVPPILPKTTEYRRNAVTCTCCGYITKAKLDAVPASPFGPRLMALVGLFVGSYRPSRRRTVELLHDVLGVTISLGAVSAIEARVSDAVASTWAHIWATVTAAPVKHSDATSWLHTGTLRSLWTVATSCAPAFKILLNGTSALVRPLFGDCTGILVSDRATVFSFWHMANRQICWSHLLRKFVSFSERDGPQRAFGEELLNYTALVFRYWHAFKDGTFDRATLVSKMAPVRQQFEACLKRAAAEKLKEISGSCEDILHHSRALWTFIDQPDVEPTNNHAERELRAFVLWRKRYFGAQSERGHLFAERLMSVVATAKKQNKNAS